MLSVALDAHDLTRRLSDGIVVLQGDVDLQNGESVDVNPTREIGLGRAKKSASDASEGRAVKSDAVKHPLPGFGAWKDRADIVDSAEFARSLRRKPQDASRATDIHRHRDLIDYLKGTSKPRRRSFVRVGGARAGVRCTRWLRPTHCWCV